MLSPAHADDAQGLERRGSLSDAPVLPAPPLAVEGVFTWRLKGPFWPDGNLTWGLVDLAVAAGGVAEPGAGAAGVVAARGAWTGVAAGAVAAGMVMGVDVDGDRISGFMMCFCFMYGPDAGPPLPMLGLCLRELCPFKRL